MANNNILTDQAESDADLTIVRRALDESIKSDKPVIIVGEDVDLLVLLTQLAKTYSAIYFLMPGKNLQKGKTREKQFFTQKSFTCEELTDVIAFVHAFSGCDTTSAMYGQGKSKLIKMLNSNKELLKSV